MIVDCHTYIFEAGKGGPFNFPCNADDLVRQMDNYAVDISIVLPLPGVATNDFAHRECRRHSDRLRGLYTPEFDSPDALRRMREFFDRWEPVGLKIHPRHQAVTVDDGRAIEIIEWAAERDLPILFDVFPYGSSLDDTATHPLAYLALGRRLPGLRMILAHAGGYRLMEAFLVAKANPLVYLDLSFTPVYFKGSSVAEDCSFLCKRIPPGRVLYGSDFPYVSFSDSLEAARLYSSKLDASTRSEVMGEGAARLFRLTGA